MEGNMSKHDTVAMLGFHSGTTMNELSPQYSLINGTSTLLCWNLHCNLDILWILWHVQIMSVFETAYCTHTAVYSMHYILAWFPDAICTCCATIKAIMLRYKQKLWPVSAVVALCIVGFSMQGSQSVQFFTYWLLCTASGQNQFMWVV